MKYILKIFIIFFSVVVVLCIAFPHSVIHFSGLERYFIYTFFAPELNPDPARMLRHVGILLFLLFLFPVGLIVFRRKTGYKRERGSIPPIA